MKKYIWSALSLATLLVFTSCRKDNTPEPVNEEELITTVRLSFTSQSGGNPAMFQFVDLDGEGGTAPVITTDTLEDSTTYDVTVEFLNESEGPAQDITAEVVEEGTEHQVFYIVGAGLNLGFVYTDSDDNGNPIGVQSTATTGSVGNGSLSLVLRHEPDKNGSGVDQGNITNAGGETDVEVTFNVNIQ